MEQNRQNLCLETQRPIYWETLIWRVTPKLISENSCLFHPTNYSSAMTMYNHFSFLFGRNLLLKKESKELNKFL